IRSDGVDPEVLELAVLGAPVEQRARPDRFRCRVVRGRAHAGACCQRCERERRQRRVHAGSHPPRDHRAGVRAGAGPGTSRPPTTWTASSLTPVERTGATLRLVGDGPWNWMLLGMAPCRLLPCRLLPCMSLPCTLLPCMSSPWRSLPCMLLPCWLVPLLSTP